MTDAKKRAECKSGKTTPGKSRSFAIARSVLAWGVCGGCALWLAPAATGEGFRNPPPGAFDLGRAGGRIAQVDDSSAIAQNPANLINVPAPEANLAPSFIFYHVDYHAANGQTDETVGPWKVLPNFFASVPLQDGKYALGMGVTVPYGIADEWKSDPTSPFRYTAPHFTELLTVNLNPTFSIKLCDQLSAGVGLDVMYSRLRLNQFVFVSPLDPSAEARFHADGFGYGGNLGLTWRITEGQRLAATFRSPMTVNYGGSANYDNIPGFGSSTFNSQIRFPTIVALGYGLQLTEKIRLETDAEWIQFSRFKDLPITLGNNPGFPSNVPENWRDTFTFGISSDWEIAPGWTLRGGYQYYQSPVPDSTFSPTIPDANQNVLTVGLNFKHKHHALEAAYGLDFYNHRNITTDQTPAFNGAYSLNVHLFAFSYRYSF